MYIVRKEKDEKIHASDAGAPLRRVGAPPATAVAGASLLTIL